MKEYFIPDLAKVTPVGYMVLYDISVALGMSLYALIVWGIYILTSGIVNRAKKRSE